MITANTQPGTPVVLDAPDDDLIPPFEVPAELPCRGVLLAVVLLVTAHRHPTEGIGIVRPVTVAVVQVADRQYVRVPLSWVSEV